MPDDLRIFPDDFVPNVQASDAYKRWAKSSPGDRARWEAFRDALLADPATAVVPAMSTKLGKALVAAGREHMSISSLVGQMQNPYPPPDPPAPPTPPPPSAISLSAPANLASVQAANPAGSIFALTGNFGNQTFTQTKAVTFQAASAGSASLGSVDFNCGSGSIELSGLNVGMVRVGVPVPSIPDGTINWPAPATDITLRNLDGSLFRVYWAQRVRILGGDWGLPTLQKAECTIAPWNLTAGWHVPTDILVDGCYIHNFGMQYSTDPHSDGIQTWGANGVVIRNNTFQYIGGTGALTMECSDYNYAPQSVIDMYEANHSLFPWIGHFRIYNNVSLDTVRQGYSPSTPYGAWYDVQQTQNIPDYDYAMVLNQNTWPRGVWNEPLFGQPQGTGYPWGAFPVPTIPPNWPPA